MRMAHETIRYEVCVPADPILGFPLSNGTWTGVIGQLMRGVCFKKTVGLDQNFLAILKRLRYLFIGSRHKSRCISKNSVKISGSGSNFSCPYGPFGNHDSVSENRIWYFFCCFDFVDNCKTNIQPTVFYYIILKPQILNCF